MMTERIGITKKIEMKEHPILFSGPMVRAILDGKKTQTRRIVKLENFDGTDPVYETGNGDLVDVLTLCPYGQPGDRLWVRESWNASPVYHVDYGTGIEAGEPYSKIPRSKPENCCIIYDADGGLEGPWRPSIHMPRWASRITLEVTGVRVERLQDISEEEAKAEGVDLSTTGNGYNNYLWHGYYGDCGMGNKKSDAWKYQYSNYDTAKGSYSSLWESINGPGSWDKNPYVWKICFRNLTKQ